jgi:cytochrome c553
MRASEPFRHCAPGLLWLAAACASAQSVQPPPAVLQCQGCHGVDGRSITPDAPHLAAQPESYLAAQLRAYRSAERRHEVMNVVARGLRDDDIAVLARWFSQMQIEVRAP